MHLCFSITAHGNGHGAISCSVINRVMQHYPEIKISVMTLLPLSYLEPRLMSEFDYYNVGSDFGMLMSSPIGIDVDNSRQQYQVLFESWSQRVEREKRLLIEIKPDILISNISPISLDAAHQLDIKTASVAPFNWAQIYKAYCLNNNVETQAVYQKMNAVYQAVELVFKPLPFVPLNDGNEIEIASINDLPIVDLDSLLKKLPSSVQRIGLIALGGLPFPLDLQNWPKIEGLHWLVDQKIPSLRTDMSQISQLDTPFLQLIAACDVIITKPGYGTYCEVASLAKYKKIRVLSLARPDWPETQYLNQFLSERVPFFEINEKQLNSRVLNGVINKLSQFNYPDEHICEDGAIQLVCTLLSEYK